MTLSANFKLDTVRSAPLLEIAKQYSEVQMRLDSDIKAATGCDVVFWSNGGVAYPAFISKPTGDDWHKKPQMHYDDGIDYYLMSPRAKTEFYAAVRQAETEKRSIKTFQQACKEAFPGCCIQIACAGNSPTQLLLKSTGFGIAKGHVLMKIPFNKIEQIRAITLPDGFEEITDTQLAELEA